MQDIDNYRGLIFSLDDWKVLKKNFLGKEPCRYNYNSLLCHLMNTVRHYNISHKKTFKIFLKLKKEVKILKKMGVGV